MWIGCCRWKTKSWRTVIDPRRVAERDIVHLPDQASEEADEKHGDERYDRAHRNERQARRGKFLEEVIAGLETDASEEYRHAEVAEKSDSRCACADN